MLGMQPCAPDRAVAELLLVRSMSRLLVTLPHAAECEIAVKGQDPVLVKVLPDYPYAARDQRLEGDAFR